MVDWARLCDCANASGSTLCCCDGGWRERARDRESNVACGRRTADGRWKMTWRDGEGKGRMPLVGYTTRYAELFCNGEMRQQETNGKCLENTRPERRPDARIGGGVAQSILLSTRLV